jgi:hypothetical protein
MTIDDFLEIADPNGVFSHTMRNQLRDAILALLDENTRACAEVCEVAFDDLAIAIRARIAARKGGDDE